MVRAILFAFVALVTGIAATPSQADYRVRRDHGGLVDVYKARYAKIRDRGERVIIDGIWQQDPTNPHEVPNDLGGNNSLLRV